MVLISVHYPWIQSNNVINIYSNNTTCCSITFQCKHCNVSSQNCQLVLCLFSLWHMILVVRLCCWCWYSFMNVTLMTAGWLIEDVFWETCVAESGKYNNSYPGLLCCLSNHFYSFCVNWQAFQIPGN